MRFLISSRHFIIGLTQAMRKPILILFVMLSLISPLLAQQPSAHLADESTGTQSDLAAGQLANRLVTQLIENVETYRATLPSLTAHETILSKTSAMVLFGKSAVHAEATMRVTRKTPQSQLEEVREFTIVNGKPVKKGKPVELPLTVEGAFSDAPAAFFDRERASCFSFVLAPHPQADAPLTLMISRSPQAATLPQCKGRSAALTAIAQIDPIAHQLIRLERTFPAEPETLRTQMLSLIVDLAPTKLGPNIFWLPTTFSAHGVDHKDRIDWVSHYSDYHQFTATSNILPAP